MEGTGVVGPANGLGDGVVAGDESGEGAGSDRDPAVTCPPDPPLFLAVERVGSRAGWPLPVSVLRARSVVWIQWPWIA